MGRRRVEHLLIGGGIAAASCAQALVEGGARDILLVGRELDPPYHRPPASKGYLQGREPKEETFIALPGEVEVLTRTSVLSLDTAAQVATLSTKEEVQYGSALLATGAMVRRLMVDGVQLDGIHYLRALGNADAIRRDAEAAERVVCIGGSFIGCEVAASLTELGKAVTVVMLEDEPMERPFGPQVGRHVRAVLEGHGIEVLGGVQVDRLEAEGDADRVARVVLADGRELRADMVVCGTGATPDVMLARKSGIELGALGGVLCDEHLRTSAPAVWAAGDMCEYQSVLHRGVVRIEHEEVAAAQGRTAARGMLGDDAPHHAVPYFWTDLADWTTLEYVSAAGDWDEEVVEGSFDDGAFTVWYLDGGRVVAALSARGHADLDRARELIAAGGALA